MTFLLGRVANDVMPDSLNKPTRYLALAAIVLGLLYALLFYTPPHGGLWTQVFFDSLHVPVFGLIAVSIYFLWHPERPWFSRASVALALTCLFGLLSEIAQIATSRDASISDFVADCLGAAGFLGVVVAIGGSRNLAFPTRVLLASLAVALLGWALAPLAAVSASYVERNSRFPIIYEADSAFGRKLIRLQNVRYEVSNATPVQPSHAAITFLDAPWPGVALHDLKPDWRSYSALVVDLEVIGDNPLALNLRVHDGEHRHSKKLSDRFTRSFFLDPGSHTLRIFLDDLRQAPQTREMDLSKISELIIFGTREEADRSIRLYSIRLE